MVKLKEIVGIRLFYLARILRGNKLPNFIKKPIGDLLVSKGGQKDTNILKDQRHEFLADLLEGVSNLDGDVIECGVKGGDSIIPLAQRLKKIGSKKIIYGIDVFDNVPYDDNDFPYEEGKFLRAKGKPIKSYQQTRQRLDDLGLDNVVLIKGFVEDELPKLDKKFCLTHVDINTYKATKFCTSFLKERCVNGGIMYFDDYNEPAWKGCNKAVDEEIGKQNLKVMPYIQAYWIKS